MCNGHLKKAGFRPALIKWFSAAAVVIVVCGLAWQALEGIAGCRHPSRYWDLSGRAGMKLAWGRESLNDIFGQLEPSRFVFVVKFWPLGAGPGLFAAAQIFNRGLEMQKGTAGLI